MWETGEGLDLEQTTIIRASEERVKGKGSDRTGTTRIFTPPPYTHVFGADGGLSTTQASMDLNLEQTTLIRAEERVEGKGPDATHILTPPPYTHVFGADSGKLGTTLVHTLAM